MNFSDFNLSPTLLENVGKVGYETPTPIQKKAIHPIMNGIDIIGIAQTGTGKTAAFVLPILHKLGSRSETHPRALIIVPTRELAEQVLGDIKTLGDGIGLKSLAVYGGIPTQPQIRALQQGVDLLVACPGRLLDLLRQKVVRFDFIRHLVLDEADRMFDMGFLPDVNRIIQKCPEKRQTLLFSATFPPQVESLASRHLNQPMKITIGAISPADTVSHALYPISRRGKTRLLLAMLKSTGTGSILVFTRTRVEARGLTTQIREAGFSVTSLHSDRTQGQRQKALDGFKQGRYRVMVATDIAARGLDISRISHVINYDMPDSEDAYIHRIGRTGRAEREGDAFTLVTIEDLPMIHALERLLGQKIERKKLDGFDYTSGDPDGAESSEVDALFGEKPRHTSSRRRKIAPRRLPFS